MESYMFPSAFDTPDGFAPGVLRVTAVHGCPECPCDPGAWTGRPQPQLALLPSGGIAQRAWHCRPWLRPARPWPAGGRPQGRQRLGGPAPRSAHFRGAGAARGWRRIALPNWPSALAACWRSTTPNTIRTGWPAWSLLPRPLTRPAFPQRSSWRSRFSAASCRAHPSTLASTWCTSRATPPRRRSPPQRRGEG